MCHGSAKGGRTGVWPKERTQRGLTSRARWIASLLDGLPAEVPDPARRRLAAALVPLFGADAVVWSTDIAELEPADAIQVMAWMASVLVRATVANGVYPLPPSGNSAGTSQGRRCRRLWSDPSRRVRCRFGCYSWVMDAEKASFAGSVADGYREYLEPVIFRPWSERLVDFVGVDAGQTVLDVAAGTGVVARAAAARVGAAGRVIASDISAGMLSHVETGVPADWASVETLECSATELDLPDGSVDVVVCQQGLPFIPDKKAAAREMRRVLRSGGKAAVAVWLSSPRVEPFIIFGEALQARGVPKPFPNAHDSSGLSMSVQEVEGALVAAGFEDVQAKTE